MKSGTFTVILEFAYDAEKGIHMMNIPKINGEEGKKVPFVESTRDTYIGTTDITIILTKHPDDKSDPCAWVWNDTLKEWVVRCWNGPFGNPG